MSITRAAAMRRVDRATVVYRRKQEELELARQDLYDALRVAYEDTPIEQRPTVRELADQTDLTFGRIGQILRYWDVDRGKVSAR